MSRKSRLASAQSANVLPGVAGRHFSMFQLLHHLAMHIEVHMILYGIRTAYGSSVGEQRRYSGTITQLAKVLQLAARRSESGACSAG